MPSPERAPTDAPLPRRAIYLVACVAIMGIYFATNRLTAGLEAFHPETALDRLIPFAPAWEHIYVSLWVFMVLPHVVIRHEGYLRRWVLAFGVTQLVAAALFVALPVRMMRPEGFALDSFGAWITALNYGIDEPSNAFPSLHVANAVLAALVALRVDRAVGSIALVVAALVAVSTFFVKQHYVIDVAGGLVLAGAVYLGIVRPYDLEAVAEDERRLSRAASLGLVAVHGVAVAGAFALYLSGRPPPFAG